MLCSGAFQRPHRPAAAASLPKGLLQVDAEDYRNPDALPPGKVLIVGSGQTGCQLAEELHHAGRDVFLACGKAPWAPRRLEGRDIFAWSDEIGFLDGKVADLPSLAARLGANIQATGHDGGHDLHYRVSRRWAWACSDTSLAVMAGAPTSLETWSNRSPLATLATGTCATGSSDSAPPTACRRRRCPTRCRLPPKPPTASTSRASGGHLHIRLSP